MHKADNLPPSCAVVTKSVNLNFLEPSGPAQACNGTALPLPLPVQLFLVIIIIIIIIQLNSDQISTFENSKGSTCRQNDRKRDVKYYYTAINTAVATTATVTTTSNTSSKMEPANFEE